MRFDNLDAMWANAEEKLADYRYDHGINCELCGRRLPVGDSCWELRDRFYCRECFIEYALDFCEREVVEQ